MRVALRFVGLAILVGCGTRGGDRPSEPARVGGEKSGLGVDVAPRFPGKGVGAGDTPKIAVALERLRARFTEGSIERLSAESMTGEDAVAASNATPARESAQLNKGDRTFFGCGYFQETAKCPK